MNQSQASLDAARALNRPSVTFETDRRYNNQNAYPFFYAFVPYPYLNTSHLNGGQGLMGIRVPAGGTVPIPIRLDRDSVFRQLSVKYTVYREVLNEALNLTITTNLGSRQVTISSTATLESGDSLAWLDTNGVVTTGVISRIISATSAALEEPCKSTAGPTALHRRGFKWYDTPVLSPVSTKTNLTGTIEMWPNQSPTVGDGYTVLGTLTLFQTELRVDDIISFTDSDGNEQHAAVKSIVSDTELILYKKFPEDVEVFAGSSLDRIDYQLKVDGEIAIPNASTAVEGFGTTFTTDLAAGDVIKALNSTTNKFNLLQIQGVGADTSATLKYATSGKFGEPLFFGTDFYKIASGGTGTISVLAGLTQIIGLGTSFLTEVKEGSTIYIQTGVDEFFNFTVDAIISNTELLITKPSTVNIIGSTYGVGIAASSFDTAVANETLLYSPMTDFVRVGFSMPSQQGRYLYGGGQTFMGADNNDKGYRMRPHLISSLQGVDDGLGQLRTPSLQPYESVVVATIYNESAFDVIVNGCIFGYKITFTQEALHE